jgi:hypothetical protein
MLDGSELATEPLERVDFAVSLTNHLLEQGSPDRSGRTGYQYSTARQLVAAFWCSSARDMDHLVS